MHRQKPVCYRISKTELQTQVLFLLDGSQQRTLWVAAGDTQRLSSKSAGKTKHFWRTRVVFVFCRAKNRANFQDSSDALIEQTQPEKSSENQFTLLRFGVATKVYSVNTSELVLLKRLLWSDLQRRRSHRIRSKLAGLVYKCIHFENYWNQ